MHSKPSDRAGHYIQQPSGYSAFVPRSLNPPPEINWTGDLTQLLVRAGTALGRLDGITRRLPNPNLFVSIFVRQEAVLSSQIEGTQCTLEDVLKFEIEKLSKEKEGDVRQVINYVEAMNYGISRLNDPNNGLPLCLRLLREIHSVLMDGRRGMYRTPGEFRKTQNWIGPGGCTLLTASFIPPPVADMLDSLTDLEKFFQLRAGVDPLIQIGLAHAQFETIHPFLDGNGRLGRLLITLFLCERDILRRPILYLSHYFKSHQQEYYKRLMAIREAGDWEGWLAFFFQGVEIVSTQAIANAEIILDLREQHVTLVRQNVTTAGALQLLDYLFENPVLNVQRIAEHLDCTFATASKLVDQFESLGLLQEITGQKRNRQYEYGPYMQFWKTAQDDFRQIPLPEKPTDIPAPKESAKGPSSQQQDQALTGSLNHIRKRLGSEATEVNWIEKQKPPSLKAQFTKNKSWLQLRFAEKTHEFAELHPTLESVYPYKADGSHIFVSFGIKGGGADIVWAFQYLKYNDRPAFRPAWEHNPWAEPLSAAEVGKMCAEQLANLSEQR